MKLIKHTENTENTCNLENGDFWGKEGERLESMEICKEVDSGRG